MINFVKEFIDSDVSEKQLIQLKSLDDKLNELSVDIDTQFVINYLEFLSKEPDHRDNALTVPCGIGKTLGLAIVLKLSRILNRGIRVMYLSSTHRGLQEFQNKLKMLDIQGSYIDSSSKLVADVVVSKSIILMTTSMYIQAMSCGLNVSSLGRGSLITRWLIIDECPKLSTRIKYVPYEFLVHKDEYITYADLVKSNALTDVEMNRIVFIVASLFNEGKIEVKDDVSINDPKFNPDRYDTTLLARLYLLMLICQRFPQDYNRLLDAEAKWREEHIVSELTLVRNPIYLTSSFSAKDVYLARYDKTLILDATADLYSELLDLNLVNFGLEKDYYKYIDKLVDLGSSKILHKFKFNINKDKFIEETHDIIYLVLQFIKSLSDKNIYIVTYDNGLYRSTEELKNIKIESELDFIKPKILKSLQFYGVVTTHDKDYIEVKMNDKVIRIANYNRNRGSNYFRDSTAVFLLGEFWLKSSCINQLIRDYDLKVNLDDALFKLAVADAVQEISRGCLRKRDTNQKESIYLLGRSEWMNAINEYLGVKSDIEKFKLSIDDSIEIRMDDYIMENCENSRKYNYCRLAKLIKDKTEFSDPSRLDHTNDIKNNHEPFPRAIFRSGGCWDILVKELGLTEEMANKVFEGTK